MRQVGLVGAQVRVVIPRRAHQKDRVPFQIDRDPRRERLPGDLLSFPQTEVFQIDDVKLAAQSFERELAHMVAGREEVVRRIEVGAGVRPERDVVDAVAIRLVRCVRSAPKGRVGGIDRRLGRERVRQIDDGL